MSDKSIKKIVLIILCFLCYCTYDSTPPGDDKINDRKPLLMIDASGFSAQRGAQIQYTDSLGTSTLASSAEKTDASGRILYPLYLARGTRNFTIILRIDESADGAFTSGTADRKYEISTSFGSDSEIKNLKLTNAADFSPN